MPSTFISPLHYDLEWVMRPGYVYVMRLPDGLYKIGQTLDLNRRLMQQKRKYGAATEIVFSALVSGRLSVEYAIKSQFEPKRRGLPEIFSLDDADIKMIREAFAALDFYKVDQQ